MRNPAPPFERQLDLANAGRRRRIEFIDRARVKVAGGSFPMSVLIMLYALDERTVIDGCIRVQLCAGRNVADNLKKSPQADQTGVALAGVHSLRDRRQLLSGSLVCVSFINRQEREQLLVAWEGRFSFWISAAASVALMTWV